MKASSKKTKKKKTSQKAKSMETAGIRQNETERMEDALPDFDEIKDLDKEAMAEGLDDATLLDLNEDLDDEMFDSEAYDDDEDDVDVDWVLRDMGYDNE